MAQPIRTYTPQRDVREELRAKVENAPIDHADALLATYKLLQQAQDHGVLDILRGAIGRGDAIVSKAAEYASSPEAIRATRNFLALSRVVASLDPAKVDAVVKAITDSQCRKDMQGCEPPSLWKTFQRITGRNSRRTLATIAAVAEAFGKEPGSPEGGPLLGGGPGWAPPKAALPLLALALAGVAGFWIGRRV
ncbi:MAG: helical membrane plugin domain-containing protein [Acidobacteriaceae bacterium]